MAAAVLETAEPDVEQQCDVPEQPYEPEVGERALDFTPGEGVDWKITATASKIAAILNMSEYDTVKSIWLKMRFPHAFPNKSNRSQRRGSKLEDGFLDMWFEDNPRYRRLSETEVTVVCETLGFPAAATPDSLALDTETNEIICIEHKTVGRWADLSLWGDEGSDVAPDGYVLQCIWQLICTGYLRCALIRSGPFLDDQVTYWVHYNAEVAEQIIAIVREFMRTVAENIEPENDGTKVTYDAMRTVYSQIIEEGKPGDDWEINVDLALQIKTADMRFDEAEAEMYRAKQDLIKVMGKARRAIIKLPREKGKSGKLLKQKVLSIATRQNVKGGGSKVVLGRSKDLTVDALLALRESVELAA
jgi:hypothetical protein